MSRASCSLRIIAVNMPDENTISPAWGSYRTTVDATEAACGLDSLSALPVGVQNAAAARTDSGPANQTSLLGRGRVGGSSGQARAISSSAGIGTQPLNSLKE